MLSFLSRQSLTVKAIIAVVLIALLIGAASWFQSWTYHRAHAQYIEEAKAWQTERAKLIADAEAKEKQSAELETQIAVLRTAAEQGKKLDAEAAAKLEEVTKEAANEEAHTDLPADCSIRAERTCAKLAGLQPPIRIDCAAYKRKIC